MTETLLKVTELKKQYAVGSGFLKKTGYVKAVDGVDFAIEKNTVFALVGESGCGKSTVARLVLRLIEANGGDVLFKGKSVFSLKVGNLKAYRRAVQIIFQDPFASLNPRMKIFTTLSEPLLIHKLCPRSEFRERVGKLLNNVGLEPDVMNRYPHEFSGGQRQRICIARALALSPELIVADEPLSSLDVSIQAQVLNLLKDLKAAYGLSFLFISHDLNVVRYFSDTIGVMYLGKIVELAKSEDLFSAPMHPYTVMLIESAPKIRKTSKPQRKTFDVTSLDVPSPIDIPSGCPFHPRCPKCSDICKREIPQLLTHNGRLASCHLL
ncbi:MAG: ATP-binding cassette domain-containing protein [Nitrospirae bacterium]|nr:ATP-binding cassette domain-containing protein [Nitrospirota bacterium]MBF0534499.1 ATP-binding cassette domain-containing protein [Nitrospirota bacterium]MBF0617125.1 ATP-binding cassette domain-containing protein [Nitrospirota bacterium]